MEQIMHYLWQHRLYPGEGLSTVDGQRLCVVDPGMPNTDAGPDFFNAKVLLDGRLWAGNVEMHLRASDWHRHGHDNDNAYDSVVLHVVEKDDARICRHDGTVIPQVVLQRPPRLNATLATLTTAATDGAARPCLQRLAEVPALLLTDWTEALGMERLQAKADRIYSLLDLVAGDWEQVCYIVLARALGFGINSDAMERLARRTPLRLLRKHADSTLQLEAMLLGQAGLLPDAEVNDDGYANRLQQEYAFLANKFSLTAMNRSAWKLFRIRPQSFPYRRVALLARYVQGGFTMLRTMLDAPDANHLRLLLNVPQEGYWATRFAFGPQSNARAAALSPTMIDTLIINAIAPLLYAYGEYVGEAHCCDRAIALLQQLPPERIAAVRTLADAGLPCRDAFGSQALLQLHNAYCCTRKCIYCRIGHRLLSNDVHSEQQTANKSTQNTTE